MIQIYTERLLLRDHVPEDLKTHHALFSDARSMRYLPEIQTQLEEQSLENLQRSIAEINREPRMLYFLRMEDRVNHTHIGEIGIYRYRGYTFRQACGCRLLPLCKALGKRLHRRSASGTDAVCVYGR